jgi:prefoldin subunit 5
MAHSGVFFRLRNIPLKGFVMTPVVDNNNNDDDDDEQEVVGLLTLTCITYQSLIKNGLKKAGFSDVKIEPFEHNAKYAAARKVFLQAGARRASYFQPERDEEMYRIFVTLENKVVVAKLNKAIAELKSAKAELTTNQQTIAEIKQALEGKEQALAASENAYNEAKVKAKTLDDNMEGLSAEHTKLYQWQLKINGERVEVERMRRELEAEKRAMTGCQQAVVEREDAVALAMFADAD